MLRKSRDPRRSWNVWVWLFLAGGLLACAGNAKSGADGSASGSEDGSEATGPTVDWSRLSSASVSGVYDGPVKLEGGRYEAEPFAEGGASRPTLRLHEEATVFGDLDADGSDEAMALLTESSGGSGSFLYLAVFAWGAEGPYNIGTELIGDRVQVRKMEFLVDKYVLNTVEAGPNESLCCPTHKRGRIVLMRGGKLEMQTEEMGILSTRDIEGFPWEVTHLERDGPVTENVKLEVVFVGGELSGSSGCNKFGTSYEGQGRLITFGPLRLTRMACTEQLMRLENAFLGRLEAVESFSFQFGRLLLNYQLDGALRSLVCEPRGSTR